MTESTSITGQLRELPLSERREALEAVVVAEFKAALLMTEAEELPLRDNFFDIGLTSLRLTEVRQRLETLLDCVISANRLFNSPTVEKLMNHLVEEALADVFDDPADGPEAGAVPDEGLWTDLLDELYRP
ncbi:acyl carrier protein [Streptomyces sp. NPDC051320]|uniref:acyl carrier protein n=1 Tax=Streptomyces sp. NPDC051320 TaxID=3154644 RepID=UPI00343AE0AA